MSTSVLRFSIFLLLLCLKSLLFAQNNTGTIEYSDSLLQAHRIYAPVQRAGQWGFIDIKGDEVIPCKYDHVEDFRMGTALVQKNGKSGLIDKEGKIILPIVYDMIYHMNTFHHYPDRILDEFLPYQLEQIKNPAKAYAKLKLGNLFGLCNLNGQILASCKYSFISPIKNGYAYVIREGKQGYIDTTGRETVPCTYDSLNSFFINHVTYFKRNGKYGFVHLATGEEMPQRYDYAHGTGCSDAGFCEDHLFEVRKYLDNDTLFGIVNNEGQEIIPCQYQYINGDDFGRGYIALVDKGKYGLRDESGNVVLPFIYDHIEPQNSHAYFQLQLNGLYGLFTTGSKVHVPCAYTWIDLENNLITAINNNKNGYYPNPKYASPPSEVTVIPSVNCIYEDIKILNDSYLFVRKNDSWYLKHIDDHPDSDFGTAYQDILIKEAYQNILPHKILAYDRLVYVKKDGEWIALDRNGKEIIEHHFGSFTTPNQPQNIPTDKEWRLNENRRTTDFYSWDVKPNFRRYVKILELRCGLKAVYLKGKWGFTDESGKIIIPCKYEAVRSFGVNFNQIVLSYRNGLTYKEWVEYPFK